MLRYVLSSLRKPTKRRIKLVVIRRLIIFLMNYLTYIEFSYSSADSEEQCGHNFLDELRDFVDENYNQSSKYLRYKDTMINFREILEGYVQEEEVSSDDEEEEENEEESGGDFFSGIGNMLPGKDFLENTTIFKMAKELQDELKG